MLERSLLKVEDRAEDKLRLELPPQITEFPDDNYLHLLCLYAYINFFMLLSSTAHYLSPSHSVHFFFLCHTNLQHHVLFQHIRESPLWPSTSSHDKLSLPPLLKPSTVSLASLTLSLKHPTRAVSLIYSFL